MIHLHKAFKKVTCCFCVFPGEGDGACLDEDQLSKPIKRFIADYLRRNVSKSLPDIPKDHYCVPLSYEILKSFVVK